MPFGFLLKNTYVPDATSRPVRSGRFAFVAFMMIAGLMPARHANAQLEVPKGSVSEVKIVGNKSVPLDDIMAKVHTRAGRDYDERTIEEDVARLVATKWFGEVRPFWKKDPEKPDAIIVTFRVNELPILREVEFRGLTKLKKKEIEDSTGLKVGARADHIKNQLEAQHIKRLYADKGYEWADVRLIEGGKPDDTRVIFEIFEGPKCKVTSISFTGNAYVNGALLNTKIGSKVAILGLGGTFRRDDLDEDVRKLYDYYHDQGFFEVKIKPVVRPEANMGDLKIEFVIWEGIQFKVRDISFDGNKLITEEELRKGLVLHSNLPFKQDVKESDLKNIQSKYGNIGCIDAQVVIEKRYADPEKSPGVVDLVYKIEEGSPYRLGRLLFKGNDHTMDAVLRREANMAGLVPGEPIDLQRVDKFKQRLGNLRYFSMTPDQGKAIDIKMVNKRPASEPFGKFDVAPTDELIRTRFQSPAFDEPGEERINAGATTARATASGAAKAVDPDEVDIANAVKKSAQRGDARVRQAADQLAPGDGPVRVAQFDGNGIDGSGSRAFNPPVDEPVGSIAAPPIDVLPDPIVTDAPAGGGPVSGKGVRTPPYGTDVPPGGYPSIPGMNMTDVGPDRQEPFPDRSYADIVTSVDEIATGRLMFGVGASSYGGLSGNLIIHETNFDAFNIPKSFSELTSGRAFRGRGQDLRIELSPGTVMNRFSVSFRDPYLFNLPIGFGASGYAFNRYYPDWNEKRGGGRFSLGRQFGTQTYADVAFRIEEVNVTGFKYPAPAEYLAVSNNTTLATLRPSLRFDNRNDPFSPSRGYYVEAAFEQGWGTFTYPKATIEGRTHFTLGSRPDGSGKRILTMRGFYGATGRDTPLYEKFFAGDFRSMRGFAYRGVGPYVFGSNIGGLSSLIGSVEFQFPWTANDRFQQVVFSDFGTVQNGYDIANWRVTVGTGFRVYLPQQMFGPLPLAFDLGFPVMKSPDDKTRLFTFFIGAFW